MTNQCATKTCTNEASHAVEFWTITQDQCGPCAIEFATAVVMNNGSLTIVAIG